MVLNGLNVDSVPISEAIAEPRMVTPESHVVQTARELGIIFGDLSPEQMAPKSVQPGTKAGKASKCKKCTTG